MDVLLAMLFMEVIFLVVVCIVIGIGFFGVLDRQ